MNYNTALGYIDSFINFEKIPKYNYASSFNLERMRAFLMELGGPHQGLKTIHISGSKGKGSTCAISASLLRQAGYRTGLYTSPHLVDVMERIRVLTPGSTPYRKGTGKAQGLYNFEGAIEKVEFVELVERIRPAAEKFREHRTFGRLSFFEALTACAFLYFEQKKVDYVVLETGLGGRLDATNVTDPIVCGITNISLEHTDKLGGALKEIAAEKAGIIKAKSAKRKAQSIVISAQQEKEVEEVIREECRHKRANLYEIGKDINYSIVKSDEKSQVFNLEGPGYSYKDLEINLIGKHQVENAVLAVSMVKEALKINEEAIRVGLKDVFWPGRLQVMQKEPYVVLDGAHNVSSIKKAVLSIKEIFTYKRLICIFGISSDKDIKGISAELDSVSDIVILTRSECSSRAEDPVNLKKNFSRSDIEITDNVNEALEKGLRVAQQEDLILITGSLYVVGEAMKTCSRLNLEQRMFEV